MKTSIALGLTLATSLAAILVPTGSVFAVTVTSATACQHWNSGEAQFPIYFADGIRNTNGIRNVICPLTVNHTAGAVTGKVFVQYKSTVATTCTLYSYNWNDVFLGSRVVALPAKPLGGGILTGTVPANPFSSHSLLCRLPANTVKIVGIESYF